MLMSIFRYRLPRIDWLKLLVLFALIGYSGFSIIWSRAPISASTAIYQYALEVGLAIGVATILMRSKRSFHQLVLPTIALAVFVAITFLVSPEAKAGGRLGILAEATVLSPAKFIGIGLILALACNDAQVRLPGIIRLATIVLFLIALFVLGARAQLAFALLSGVLAGFLTGRLGKLVLIGTFAAGFFGLVFWAFGVTLSTDIFDAALGSGRYTIESVGSGLSGRLDNILSCFTLDSPVLGHGLLDWAYERTGRDTYVYPHNSIAQVYYELGLIGLGLFSYLVFIGFYLAYRGSNHLRPKNVLQQVYTILLTLLLFEFLVSLKQGTFMNCLGVYFFSFAIISITTNERRRNPLAPNRSSRATTSEQQSLVGDL